MFVFGFVFFESDIGARKKNKITIKYLTTQIRSCL